MFGNFLDTRLSQLELFLLPANLLKVIAIQALELGENRCWDKFLLVGSANGPVIANDGD